MVRVTKRAQLVSTVLATDGSPEAGSASEFLCGLSLPQWTEVMVVSVAEAEGNILTNAHCAAHGPNAEMPETLRRTLHDAAEARVAGTIEHLRGCGAQVRGAVRFGHPADEILSAARDQDADLIVVGARGRTRTGPFRLGRVAQEVVRYAQCSVLVGR